MSDTENTRTRLIRRTDLPWGDESAASGGGTPPYPGNTRFDSGGDTTVKLPNADAPTILINPNTAKANAEPAKPADDGRTIIYRQPAAAGPSAPAEAPKKEGEVKRPDPMDDPVVGWVVIVKGPGTGSSKEIKLGMNTVGREASNRVQIDWGDMQISRGKHFAIVFDRKFNKFHAIIGDGTNLSYINESPLLQPMELKAHDRIQIGETTLMFVPFCGPQFEWEENKTAKKPETKDVWSD